MESFGSRIVALREARGWSRNRLHIEAGLSYSYLHGVETGEWLPGRENLLKIVDAIGPQAEPLLEERDRLEYERMGLDPDATLLLKELEDLSQGERKQFLSLYRRIKKQRETANEKEGGRG
jgi:transcriptional regulator with XRE-family HTH domain